MYSSSADALVPHVLYLLHWRSSLLQIMQAATAACSLTDAGSRQIKLMFAAAREPAEQSAGGLPPAPAAVSLVAGQHCRPQPCHEAPASASVPSAAVPEHHPALPQQLLWSPAAALCGSQPAAGSTRSLISSTSSNLATTKGKPTYLSSFMTRYSAASGTAGSPEATSGLRTKLAVNTESAAEHSHKSLSACLIVCKPLLVLLQLLLHLADSLLALELLLGLH